MSKHTFIAITLAGDTLDNRGKGYVSRRAAQQAAERRGLVVTQSRRMDERLPHLNDAQGWSDYSLRHGHT